MPNTTTYPYRAEHVGSFPRPERLIKARADFAGKKISRQQLKEVEYDCTREIVAMQERVGIGAITDGEFPKSGWREFLFEKCDGFEGESLAAPYAFRTFEGDEVKGHGINRAIRPIRRHEPLSADDFDVLKGLTERPIKSNIPSPSIAHMPGDMSFDRSVYRDRDTYLADVAAALREEVADLATRGCDYVQIDEVPLAVLCDPKNRETVKARGEDPDAVIDAYIRALHDVFRDAPATMTIAIHMCRGNRGHGMADGGYESLAERMFGSLEVSGYFLEYDTARSGDFSPLRFIPKGTKAVLGLISTKTPALEDIDALRRRIDEAARYKDIDDLCLSPQCGFSSTATSGPGRLTMNHVEAKLRRVVEVAELVWR